MTTVHHTTGTLELAEDELVATMAGTRGLFRKERWERVDRTPIAEISAVRVTQDGERVDLTLVRRGGLPVGYSRCGPLEAIEELLEQVVERSPGVTVNDVDAAAERARLVAEAQASGNEIVGVDRRVTLTRLVLGGVVGGLLFKKRQVVRRRDV